MADFENILFEQANGIVTITLNRPEKYNALTEKVSQELIAALKTIERDDGARCVVLTGAGKGFCAGQDLTEVRDRGENFSLRDHLNQNYNKMVQSMRALEKPIIVAVNGACAGAGFGLALAGDFRYASDSAKFLTAFIGIGLAPDTGVSYWLPRMIGPARAAEMLFTNERVDAETAAQIGIVNKVFAADELMAETMKVAQHLAQSPTRGIGLSKRALNKSMGVTFDEMLDYEGHLQDVAARTSDYVEGTSAFREKRKPQFTGR